MDAAKTVSRSLVHFSGNSGQRDWAKGDLSPPRPSKSTGPTGTKRMCLRSSRAPEWHIKFSDSCDLWKDLCSQFTYSAQRVLEALSVTGPNDKYLNPGGKKFYMVLCVFLTCSLFTRESPAPNLGAPGSKASTPQPKREASFCVYYLGYFGRCTKVCQKKS